MTRTLYEISADLAALESILLENAGDISDPAATAAFEEWERELSSDLIGKVDRYVGLITEMEARAEARQTEAERLQVLSDLDRKAAKSLRERLLQVMESRGIPPLQTPRFRVSIAKNGGKRPLDIRCGLDELPVWAVKRETVVTANKDAIRERLESGEVLPFASLMERGNRLAIK